MSSQQSPMPSLSSTQQQSMASQTNFLTGDNNPQNLYNKYSSLVFGGGGSTPNFGQPATPQISPMSQPTNGLATGGMNGQLPTHTEQVPAQVTDYSQLFNSLNQYLTSMNDLLGQYQQK